MSIQWGRALRNGFQGIKVGVSVDWENVSHGEGAATATVKYYGAVRAHSNDNPTLHMSGAVDGTVDFNNNHGRNGDPDYDVFLIATRSYTYNYGGSEYGSSPGTRTFSAQITGTYNGLSPSVSVKSRIPARPYAKPAEQGDCTATYINDGRAKITWSRVSSAGAPVRAVRVIRYEWINGGGRYDNGTTVDRLSARATQYYDNGIEPNRVYYYHVRAYNPAGWGPENHSAQNICTTPAGPSSIHAHVNAAGDAVVVDAHASNNYNDAASGDSVQYELERRVNGGPWQSLASGKSGPSLTDNNPGAGSNQYRVRAVSNYGSQTPLRSDWLTSNVVSTIVPPLAPINLYPNGITVDATEDMTVRYTYRDGGDGAAQTAVKWRISDDFGQSWTEYGPVETAQTSFTVPGGTNTNGSTYQYQIATRAIKSEGFGPWSAVATVECAARPVVVITSPTATTTTGHITVKWSYSQAGGSPQAVASVALYESDGVTQLESRFVNGEATSQAFEYYCQDGETYVVAVQVQARVGISSENTLVTTTIDIPSPALVDVTPEFQADTGRAVLHLEAGTPATGEADVTHVSVDRSVDNGASWVRMAESLDLPVDFVDPIPTVAGANVYRLTSISDEPAYRANPDVTLYTPSGLTTAPTGDERLGAWTYLSYGPSFSETLKIKANPQVQPKPSRAAAAPAYLGQRMPRAQFGTQRSVSYAFSGAVFPGDGASSPQEWIKAQLDADIVCFRDAKGRRVFGVLSDMDAPESYELVSSVSFTVTETAFMESYGAAVQPVAVVNGQFIGLANNGDGTYTLSLPGDGALQPVGDGTWTLTPGL